MVVNRIMMQDRFAPEKGGWVCVLCAVAFNSHVVAKEGMADFADIKEVTKRALQVQNAYYTALDGGADKRAELVQMYFPSPQSSLMQWNGHNLATTADILQYLAGLPKTKHVAHCVDAQPLPGNTGGDTFLVTITGTVTYDDEHKRFYFQRLVIMAAEVPNASGVGVSKKYYIVNDYMRWTGEA